MFGALFCSSYLCCICEGYFVVTVFIKFKSQTTCKAFLGVHEYETKNQFTYAIYVYNETLFGAHI